MFQGIACCGCLHSN